MRLMVSLLLVFLMVFSTSLSVLNTEAASSPQFNDPAFATSWQRVDKPVAELSNIGRGYSWGPVVAPAVSVRTEIYNGKPRQVQYFDKARMEINDPTANPTDLFYVTTGLLVKELVSGMQQDGDSLFTTLGPSEVPVAGDPNQKGQNAEAPTYASFSKVATLKPDENTFSASSGSPINQTISKAGQVSSFTPPETRLLTAYDAVTHHNLADVFVAFSEQQGLIWNGTKFVNGPIFFANPVYVLGRPLTEPYWIKAKVAGQPTPILVQLFERRVLTYTPTNPPAFKVEMGNVGQHYYAWRHGSNPASLALFPNDFSQLRAAYQRSGPIPAGDEANLRTISSGSTTSNIFNTPVVDTNLNLAVFAAAENGIIGVSLNDDPAKVAIKWKYQPEPPPANVALVYGGSPLLYQGVVYIGVGSKLYALNASDGSLRWVKPLTEGVPIVGAPITDGINLYLTASSGSLYAVQLVDGALVWQRSLGGQLAAPYTAAVVTSGPIFGFDNNLFFATTGGKVLAYTRQGGTVSDWVTPALDAGIYATPAYANGIIYLGTQAGGTANGGNLFALERNGKLQGEVKLGGSIYNTPVVVGGRVYVAVRAVNNDPNVGKIIGVSASNLTKIEFEFDVASTVDASLAVVDNYLYFGADNGNFYQVSTTNPAQSKILFRATRLFNVNSAVVANGWIYVSNADGNLYLCK